MPINRPEDVMRLFIFNPATEICAGFALILGAYGFLIWLIAGCLSFAKLAPTRNACLSDSGEESS